MDSEKLTLVMTANIPAEGVELFREYETKVLPLLAKHNGTLERRMSNGEGTVEMHVLSFANKQAFEAFSVDPERLKHTEIFDKSGAQTEVRQMMDYPR